MIAEFLLTCSGIPIFLVFHNLYFRPLRILVKPFLAVFHAVLFWQLFLNLLLVCGSQNH
jgi:hypothetical protein